MEGKLVRIINKIIETSRKDNKEKIVKEEVFRFPDEKDNTVRPLEGGGTENP